MPCPFGVAQYVVVDANRGRGTGLAEALGGGYVVASPMDIPLQVKMMIVPAPVIMVARDTSKDQLSALKAEFGNVIGYDPSLDPAQLVEDVRSFREEYEGKRERGNPVSMDVPDSIDVHLVHGNEPWIVN